MIFEPPFGRKTADRIANEWRDNFNKNNHPNNPLNQLFIVSDQNGSFLGGKYTHTQGKRHGGGSDLPPPSELTPPSVLRL